MRLNPKSIVRSKRTSRFDRLPEGHTLQSLEQRALLAVDLAYTDLSVANNVLPGGTVQVNSTIQNNGDTDATTNFGVQFYLSQDGTLDGGDTLLGTFTNDVTLTANGGNRGFPFDVMIPGNTATGNYFLIARADSTDVYAEADEANNVRTDAFFVGNLAPTIGQVTVNPDPVGRLGTFTLSAINVTDADGINNGAVTVSFYYDDGDDVFSPMGDQFIGQATGNNGTFTLRTAVPGFVTAGAGKIIAVASDQLDENAVFQGFTAVDAAAPTLANLTGPTSAVRRGREITLTATNVTGTNGAAEFYRDVNGNGTFEADVDELLGNGVSDGAGNRTLAVTIDPAWGEGDQVFFARAVDSLGQVSAADSVTVDLAPNNAPRIGGLLARNRAEISKGQQIVLTARNVSDDDGPETVEFYRERSGNSQLNVGQDELLGEGTRQGNSWVFTITAPVRFANGVNRFYARAVDIVGATSNVRTTTINIRPNTRPTVGTFTINKTAVDEGGRVTFLARNVTDNGGVNRVAFYFDSNNNGRFDVNTDRFLTNGVRQGESNNWRKLFTLPTTLPTGTRTYFAVAFDNLGVRGPVKTDTLRIRADT